MFIVRSITIIITAAILFFINSECILSQVKINQDSVITGKTYKFVLYNDDEIIGKVISIDSVYIHVKADQKAHRIKKDDIFIVTTELIENNCKAILSFGAGIAHFGFNFTNNEFTGKYSIQLNALFPLSGIKGLRVDGGFTRFDSKFNEQTYTYAEGPKTINMYYLKCDFVFGDMEAGQKEWAYGIAGVGLHFWNEPEYESNYFNSLDSTYHTYQFPGFSYTNAVLSIGAALGYRFTKHFGIYGDIQLNAVTFIGYFPFFVSEAYIPVRVGITYTIF
jgi:hypothetical protein